MAPSLPAAGTPPRWFASRHRALVVGSMAVLFVALIIAATTVLRVRHQPGTPGFAAVLIWQLIVWLPWVPLTRVLFSLAERRPVPGNLIGNAALHLAVSLVLAGLHAGWFFVVSSQLSPYLGVPDTKYGAYRFFFLFWIQVDLLLYWALLGVTTSWNSLERLRERELRQAELKGQLAAAQLQALKLQIRPHFLFNVLNTIVAMQRAGEHDKATQMTLSLSDVLRLILSSGEADEVPLARELELVKRYLEIESFRFEDAVTVELAVEAGLGDCRVPSLLLQPLVENAIHHGGNGASGELGVRVSVESLGRQVRIEVSNDAAPFQPPSHDGLGIGLSNVRRRLQSLYGAEQELVVSERSGRTQVLVTLPRRPASSPAGGGA